MAADLVPEDGWVFLRRHTAARIALGRSGGSLPTRETLGLAYAQALARDAVRAPFDPHALAAALRPLAPDVLVLESAAPDRAAFLARPDLGRRLSERSAALLAALPRSDPPPTLAIVVSDGLSALAAERQASPLLAELLPLLRAHGFRLAPLVVVRHARVGLLDPVGSALGAEMALILLGERPGLGTPDSLGAYLAYGPGPGRTDADRNCVSNIRPEGLVAREAAARIAGLLAAAREFRLTGPALKEPPSRPSLGAK